MDRFIPNYNTNYKEKLEMLLKANKMCIGEFIIDNISCYINNNGGEVNFGIVNTNIHVEVAYDLNTEFVRVNKTNISKIFIKFINECKRQIEETKIEL